MGLTKDVVQFVSSFKYEQIPEEAKQIVKNAFIDTIGVAIAGKNERTSEIVRELVREEQSTEISTIWGGDLKSTAANAAMVNGTMAHVLDFDDLNSKTTLGHPSAAIVPAVMAVSEEVNASGKDAILSYFVGFEVMAYMGKVIGYDHYNKGWHGTATLGVLACTAAAGKLYKLSEDQLQNAFGIAVSLISGTRQNFGSMTKPYHPGNAARSGITASKLAKKGFTGSQSIFEAPLGFLHLYSETGKPMSTEQIGDVYELTHTKLSVKRYPCCYGSHRAIDAMQLLLEGQSLNASQIDEIIVKVPKGGFTPLIHVMPKNGLEAKFSMEYPLAALLIEGKVTISSFNDDRVIRPEIQEIMRKVSRVEDPSILIRQSVIEEGHVQVILKLKDGTTYSEKVSIPKGNPAWPLTEEELREKFMDCVKTGSKEINRNKIFECLKQLDELKSLNKLVMLL